MYAIRKSFSGFIYDYYLLGINIKSWMIISQLLGYTISKFIGIKLVGGLNRDRRQIQLLILLGTALLPLFAMTFLPIWTWPILMFFNGIPLGIVWGIVFSYVEGRNLTELIGSILACTFVFSSGFVKYITIYIYQKFHFSELKSICIVSLTAFILAGLFSYLLRYIPNPDAEEIIRNSERKPLNKEERKALIQQNLYILVPAISIYAIFTFLRDFRDNFTSEILNSSGKLDPSKIANYETTVTVFLIFTIPLISRIKKHFYAILCTFIICAIGGIVCLLVSLLYFQYLIGIDLLFILSGASLYLGYILINISLMDRVIGYNQKAANAGFLMYTADASGYMVSIVLMSVSLFSTVNLKNISEYYSYFLVAGSVIVSTLAIHTTYKIYKHDK